MARRWPYRRRVPGFRTLLPRGVSLIEVLVATVILAIGIAGAQAALLGAARYRAAADAREALAAVAVERMVWIERRGCTVGDTSGTSDGARGARLRWTLRAESVTVRVLLDGRVPIGPREHRLLVEESLPCG